MTIRIGLVSSIRIFACYAALALAMVGQAWAQNERQARPDDRAAVAACLKIAIAAAKRRAESQTKSDDATAVQQEKIDPAAWIAALAAKHVEIDRSSCIGVVSSPCQTVPENSSTMSMAECSRRELAVWDERLNAAYKTWIGKCDSKTVCEARRKLERAWIAYRDALCALPRIETDGTIAIIEGSECMLGATARQAIWIEEQTAASEDR
ncbi:MAG: lysozyme inhibitor LprI family protein [Rhodoplanes sp.]